MTIDKVFARALAGLVVASSLSGCGAVMAYRRMEQYNNLQTDHDALAACLRQGDRDCSHEQALYNADAMAAGSMTRGNSHISATATLTPAPPTPGTAGASNAAATLGAE